MNNDKKDRKNVLNLDKAFDKAERNARARDFEIEKEKFKEEHRGVEKEHFEEAMRTLSYASGKDIYVGTKRSPSSKVKFAQIIQENMKHLYENNYLTSREKIFLMDIIPYVAFSSNCIVFDIKLKSPSPCNVSEIGKIIKTERSHTSKIINSLKKKGLIAKSESGVECNNAKSYAIFLNPHILYAGDKDNINETLIVMFNKAMKMPILKNLPNRFF